MTNQDEKHVDEGTLRRALSQYRSGVSVPRERLWAQIEAGLGSSDIPATPQPLVVPSHHQRWTRWMQYTLAASAVGFLIVATPNAIQRTRHDSRVAAGVAEPLGSSANDDLASTEVARALVIIDARLLETDRAIAELPTSEFLRRHRVNLATERAIVARQSQRRSSRS